MERSKTYHRSIYIEFRCTTALFVKRQQITLIALRFLELNQLVLNNIEIRATSVQKYARNNYELNQSTTAGIIKPLAERRSSATGKNQFCGFVAGRKFFVFQRQLS